MPAYYLTDRTVRLRFDEDGSANISINGRRILRFEHSGKLMIHQQHLTDAGFVVAWATADFLSNEPVEEPQATKAERTGLLPICPL